MVWLGRLIVMMAVGCVIVAPVARAETASNARATAAQPIAQPIAQAVPGSFVVLDLAPSYIASDRFPGFIDEARGVSILVSELPPEAYKEVTVAFTPAALLSRGMIATTPGTLKREQPFLYVTAEQSSPIGPIDKYVLALPSGSRTALITVSVVRHARNQGLITEAEVEAFLSTARFAATQAPARTLFTLSYYGPFSQTPQSFAGAQLFVLADAPQGADAKDSLGPVLVIAPSTQRAPIADLEKTVEAALQSLEHIKNPEIVSQTSATTDNQPSVEVIATGTDPKTGDPMTAYQLLVADPTGGYMRLLGLARSEAFGPLLPEFRKIGAGFAFKKAE